MNEIILNRSADKSQRIQILMLLRDKAEGKVFHADTFRQRNMNYAIGIFAGIMAVEIKLANDVPQRILSTILTVLMVIFTIWDRRWHKTKHGWDAASEASFDRLVKLSNNPDQNVSVSTYEVNKEKTAEWFSWQPIVFYFLVVASIASYWVFGK